jgi:hypothetical protein
MRIGVISTPIMESGSVSWLELESRGFVSLYVPEHTHIPTSR